MAPYDAPRKRNWRLYHLLDFKPPVSTTHVKYAARKATLRTQYQQAYTTLTEVNKKSLYDAGGEPAYAFISSATWGPVISVLSMKLFSLLYVIILEVEVALLIAFFVLLGLRVDDNISTSWDLVAIPIEIFGGVMILVTIAALVVACCKFFKEQVSFFTTLVPPIGLFLAAAAYGCTAFIIGAAVKDNPKSDVGDYMKYMIPPIIGDTLYYGVSLFWRWPSLLERLMTIDGGQPSGAIAYGIFVFGVLHWLCGVAQWVCLGLKIDGGWDAEWYFVFLPFAVRGLLRVLEAFLRSMMYKTLRVRGMLGVVFDTLGSFFSNGILVISLYFVAVRIERGKNKVHMYVALIPVYLTLAYIFFTLLYTLYYLWSKADELEAEETRLTHIWTPNRLSEERSDGQNSKLYEPIDEDTASFPSNVERHKEPLDDYQSISDVSTDSEQQYRRTQGHQAAAVHHHPYDGEEEREKRHEPAEDDSFSDVSGEESDVYVDDSPSSTSSDGYEDADSATQEMHSHHTKSSSLSDRDNPAGNEDSSSYEYIDEEYYEEYTTEDVTPQSREP